MESESQKIDIEAWAWREECNTHNQKQSQQPPRAHRSQALPRTPQYEGNGNRWNIFALIIWKYWQM